MGSTADDLWAQIIAFEQGELHHQLSNVPPIYQRRQQPNNVPQLVDLKQVDFPKEIPVSLAGITKRVSWNRSLSIRGRTSIAVAACVDNQLQQKQAKRKGKPALPKPKIVQPQNFTKEKEYFQDVDAFELLEESPSPKHADTWAIGNQNDTAEIPYLASRLEKWLISRKLKNSCGPSSTLSKILDTPALPLEPMYGDNFASSNFKTPEKSSLKNNSVSQPVHDRHHASLEVNDEFNKNLMTEKSSSSVGVSDQGCEDIETAFKKLSLGSTVTASAILDSHADLLTICGQSRPLKLLDMFSKLCDPECISKIGEGTYGEAFRAGNCVCKIVPIDGDLQVNGEVQKRSEELLEEAILSQMLNQLKENRIGTSNSCSTFIETLDIRVCQGRYDAALISAWEKWDEEHGSENDHPKEFPEKQCYVVFVLQHGGKDLESFVLLNFDEARSLLVQVIVGLAVAEAAYEFEHRDLHWGNILLSRIDSAVLEFTLEGNQMGIRTFGLQVLIIDFTLSRINTGKEILFLDLSSDPYLFKGPKGDKQSETYRKMKDVTQDYWEGSFPRTNVLWLIYLVDILLLKKSFECSSRNKRDLRSLKKCLENYNSAKEALFDPFFSDLLVDRAS